MKASCHFRIFSFSHGRCPSPSGRGAGTLGEGGSGCGCGWEGAVEGVLVFAGDGGGGGGSDRTFAKAADIAYEKREGKMGCIYIHRERQREREGGSRIRRDSR